MPSPFVTLGSVTFRDHEVPERIPFGGKQRLVKHRLVGGRRIVDAMGPDEGDRRWEGRFRGPSALPRARAVDAMRIAGAQVVLAWGGLSFTVVIEAFEADYRRSTDIPYRIECCVVDDAAAGPGALVASVGALVGGDLGALSNLAGGLTGAVGGALDALGDAVGAVAGPLESLSDAALVPLQDLAGHAVTALDGAVAAGENALGALGALDPAALAPPQLFAALADQAGALAGQAATAEARALAGRIDANLAALWG